MVTECGDLGLPRGWASPAAAGEGEGPMRRGGEERGKKRQEWVGGYGGGDWGEMVHGGGNGVAHGRDCIVLCVSTHTVYLFVLPLVFCNF